VATTAIFTFLTGKTPMQSGTHFQLRLLASLAAVLLIGASAACGPLLAQSGMFPNSRYNAYGRGLYLNNYAELYGLTARSRGNAANVYPQANTNFQTFGSRANNQGGVYYPNGNYIQNYNSTPYYDPYRNN
jgi:hypothetical protein